MADQLIPLLTLPLYYGIKGTEGTPKDSLSAEQFISRTEALQRQQGWNNQRTAQMALSFLRGEALNFFDGPMTLWRSAAEQNTIREDFTNGFLPVFKAKFGQMRNIHDMSAQWSRLKQSSSETASQFMARTSIALIHLLAVMPPIETDEPTNPNAAFTAMMTEHGTPALVTEMERVISVNMLLGQTRSNTIWRDLVISMILVQGLRDPKLADKIQDDMLKKKSLEDIYETIERATRKAKTGAKNGSGKNGNLHANAVSKEEKNKKKKKDGEKKKRDFSKVQCYECNKFGHIRPQCPDLKVAEVGNEAVEDGNETDAAIAALFHSNIGL